MLVKMARSELALGHEIFYGFVRIFAVYNCRQIVRFLNVLAGNPVQKMIYYYTVILN